MSEENCKHQKLSETSRVASGPITAIVQSCQDCKAERLRTIFSIRIPGLTVLSDDAGPWTAARTL